MTPAVNAIESDLLLSTFQIELGKPLFYQLAPLVDGQMVVII